MARPRRFIAGQANAWSGLLCRCGRGPLARAVMPAVLGAVLVCVAASIPSRPALAAVPINWTPAVKFDPEATSADPVTGVSCTPGRYCLAVDKAGGTFVWTRAWTRGPSVGSDVQDVTGVSCVSPSFCVAIGTSTLGTRVASYAVTWTGKRWRAPVMLYSGAVRGAGYYGEVQAVSCTSESFCMLIGGQVNSLVFDGSRWKRRPGRTTGTDGQGVVACATRQFCLDIHDGFFNVWTGRSWDWTSGAPQQLSGAIPGLTNFVDSISCVSAHFCVAVDQSTAPLLWNGRSWRYGSDASGADGFSSVSCATPRFCVAASRRGVAADWHGDGWRVRSPLGLGVTPVLVSCVNQTGCLAVSVRGDAAFGAVG